MPLGCGIYKQETKAPKIKMIVIKVFVSYSYLEMIQASNEYPLT